MRHHTRPQVIKTSSSSFARKASRPIWRKNLCATLVALLVLFGAINPIIAESPKPEVSSVIYLGDNGVIVIELQIQVGGKSVQQSFQKYVDDLMAAIGTDDQGFVSTEKAQGKFLNARAALQAQLIPQSEVVAPNTSPDISPADGKISRAEFTAYFKRIGLQPFLVRYQPNAAPAANRRARQAGGTPDVPLFAALDTNNDSRLSAAELTGALKTLKKMDLDDDETISTAELNPLVQVNFDQPQMGNQRPAVTSPFLGIGSDESIQKQVRRLIDRYDSTDADKSGVPGSKVRNQKLSAKELGISPEAFARYDGDGDGQLDFDELRQFITAPEPTVTIALNLDSGEQLQPSSSREELQEKLKISPDGAVNINLGTTQISVVRLPTDTGLSAETLLKPQFMVADADANGYLEKSETEQFANFGGSFEELDVDKNGKVFLDEAVAFFQIRYDAARSRTVLTVNEQGRTLFEILDTDRDGRLAYRELKSAADKLSLWDKDGDGMLSESEIPQQFRLTVARGNLPSLGGTLISLPYLQNGSPAERTTGPTWFRKMDKNRDGEVSAREFLGEIATFEKLDRNHDGFIDSTEASLTSIE